MAEEKKFLQGKVTAISFAHFVHDVYSSFLAPLLPLLVEKFSLSLSAAGFLSVVQRFPSLLNPFVGLLAERLPIRYILIMAPALTATLMSLIGIMPHITLIILLLITSGISGSFFHVPAPIMIKRVSGDRIGKGMSYFMLGGEIARGVGPLYVLGGISLWGLEGTYRLLPLGLLSSVSLFFMFKNIPIADELKRKKKKTGAMNAVKEQLPFFISIGGIILFTSLVKRALTSFLPIYLTHNGSSLWMAGIALSVVQFSGAAGNLFTGTLSDKIGRRKTLLLMSGLAPLLLVLFVYTADTVFALPLLVVIGLVMFATTPVLLAEVNTINSEYAGLINGIFMTLNFVLGAIAMLLIGIFGDYLGLKTTYLITAAISFFSLFFVFRLPQE
jgi:FSR family fosmidomycin resistance protein-like MFS transporter